MKVLQSIMSISGPWECAQHICWCTEWQWFHLERKMILQIIYTRGRVWGWWGYDCAQVPEPLGPCFFPPESFRQKLQTYSEPQAWEGLLEILHSKSRLYIGSFFFPYATIPFYHHDRYYLLMSGNYTYLFLCYGKSKYNPRNHGERLRVYFILLKKKCPNS